MPIVKKLSSSFVEERYYQHPEDLVEYLEYIRRNNIWVNVDALIHAKWLQADNDFKREFRKILLVDPSLVGKIQEAWEDLNFRERMQELFQDTEIWFANDLGQIRVINVVDVLVETRNHPNLAKYTYYMLPIAAYLG